MNSDAAHSHASPDRIDSLIHWFNRYFWSFPCFARHTFNFNNSVKNFGYLYFKQADQKSFIRSGDNDFRPVALAAPSWSLILLRFFFGKIRFNNFLYQSPHTIATAKPLSINRFRTRHKYFCSINIDEVSFARFLMNISNNNLAHSWAIFIIYFLLFMFS